MAHPTDTQVGIHLWDFDTLDWRKVTLSDLKALSNSGYTRRLAYDGSNVEYLGFALPGTSSASVGWKILKYTYSSGLLTAIEFANGHDEFLFVWDNRETYDYS